MKNEEIDRIINEYMNEGPGVNPLQQKVKAKKAAKKHPAAKKWMKINSLDILEKMHEARLATRAKVQKQK